jgi:hypothetical protein
MHRKAERTQQARQNGFVSCPGGGLAFHFSNVITHRSGTPGIITGQDQDLKSERAAGPGGCPGDNPYRGGEFWS